MTAAATLKSIAAAGARDRWLIAARRGEERVMTDDAEKTAALVAALRALDGIGAGAALIGGVAVGIHSGVPRATLDVDLAVRSTVERAGMIAAMTGAGFTLTGEHAHSINFRHSSGEPVQLAVDPSFDAMIDRAERIGIGAGSIPVVLKEDLIEMKRTAAADPARRRSKALRDQADIELLLGDVPDPDEGW